jgi:hypothetical protein
LILEVALIILSPPQTRFCNHSPFKSQLMRQSGRGIEKVRRLVGGRTREASSLSLVHLGLTYAGSVALYGLGGWWLDKKLGTLPAFTLVGVALGAVGGFIWIYREVIRAETLSREKKQAEAREEETRKS